MKSILCTSLAVLFLTFQAEAQFTCLVSNQPVNAVVWAGCSVTLTQTGTPTCSYQWKFNSTNIPDYIVTTVVGGGTNTRPNGVSATNACIYPRGLVFDTAGNLYAATGGFIYKITPNGLITLVAGKGSGGIYSGDGMMATNATLGAEDLCFDSKGNLYFVSFTDGSYRVHRMGTNGLLSSVVGNGTNGFSGDGGYATNAAIWPYGLTLDAADNLYIADTGASRVRKVNTNGIITTVAGNGIGGYSGDGGYATNASLGWPRRVKVDAKGNLYILEQLVTTAASRIRKVDTNGIITTVAGNGFAIPCVPGTDNGILAVNAPFYAYGFGLDNAGNLLIADVDTPRIRAVYDGYIYYLAGTGTNGFGGDGGPACAATFNFPYAVVSDSYGNLFVADYLNARVRKISHSTGPCYFIGNAQPCDSGNYQVVNCLTNGSNVTSGSVCLTVTTNPVISKAVKSSGRLALNLVNRPGSTNVVLMATNLAPPVNWLPVTTNIAGADGNWQFTDTNLNSPRKYYRSVAR